MICLIRTHMRKRLTLNELVNSVDKCDVCRVINANNGFMMTSDMIIELSVMYIHTIFFCVDLTSNVCHSFLIHVVYHLYVCILI